MATIQYGVSYEFTHIQSTANNIWDVDYKRKVVPIVEVRVNLNGTLEKILPQNIELINDHTVRISFATPFTGVARIIA